MAKRPAPTTTWGTIARVLRDLGLTQGRTGDFRVIGYYRNGERLNTLVGLHGLNTGSDAQCVVFDNADAIEEATAAYGFPFYVSVTYFSNGKRFVSVDNHPDRVREEAPANAYVRVPGDLSPAPETSPDIATDDMLTVCADGRVREIARTEHKSGEAERVICTDGSAWVAANCMKPQPNHLPQESPCPDASPAPDASPPAPYAQAPQENASALLAEAGVYQTRPIPDLPGERTPLEHAARMVQQLGAQFSVEYLRLALEPYFQQARRDALNEALNAMASRASEDMYRPNYTDAMRVVKRLRDAT